MNADPRSICIEVCDRIINFYGYDSDFSLFPELERFAVLAITATGIIENGGFEYLFGSLLPGDSHYMNTVESFYRINALAAAAAVEKALALFPNSIAPDDRLVRNAMFKTHSEDERESIDLEFFDALDKTYESLANYLLINGLCAKWSGQTNTR
jgi:hypothetical protein